MSIHRSALLRRRRSDALETRIRNRAIKQAERARRDHRMMERIKAGSLPYAPAVMSWLSRKLEMPAARITQEDVKGMLS